MLEWCLIIFKKEESSIFRGYLTHFSAETRKTKKKLFWKNFLYFSKKRKFLYFGKWNFLALRLKTFLYFLKKKFFLYFGKWNFLAPSLRNFLYFRRELFGLKKFKKTLWKNFLYFRKWNFLAPSLKNSYIFSKKSFFIFQERTCKAWKTRISYILGGNYVWPFSGHQALKG